MIKPLLYTTLIAISGASTDPVAGPDEVSFTGDAVNFRARLKPEQFLFESGDGARSTAVRPCNEKIIRTFWNDLVAHARTAERDQARAGEGPRGATLKIGEREFAVGRFDALYYYFNRAPRESLVVFAQSSRACREVGAIADEVFDRELRPLLEERASVRQAREAQLARSRIEVLSRANFRPDPRAEATARRLAEVDSSVKCRAKWRAVEMNQAPTTTASARADADQLARDAERIAKAPGHEYLAPYLVRTFGRAGLRLMIPTPVDRVSAEAIGHERARLTVLADAGETRAKPTTAPVLTKAARAQRLALETSRLTAPPASVDHCREVFASPAVGPTLSAERPGRTIASAPELNDIKTNLRAEITEIAGRTRAWDALKGEARMNHAYVSLFWGEGAGVCEGLLP